MPRAYKGGSLELKRQQRAVTITHTAAGQHFKVLQNHIYRGGCEFHGSSLAGCKNHNKQHCEIGYRGQEKWVCGLSVILLREGEERVMVMMMMAASCFVSVLHLLRSARRDALSVVLIRRRGGGRRGLPAIVELWDVR